MPTYAKGAGVWHVINTADATPKFNSHKRLVLTAEDGSECNDLRGLTAPNDSAPVCHRCSSAATNPTLKAQFRARKRAKSQ